MNRLQEISGRKPLSSPKRHTVRFALFAIVNLVWISLMAGLTVLSGEGPQDFDDLICLWIILVPSTGFAIIMAYLLDKKANRLAQEQLKSNEEAKQKPEERRNTEG